MARKLVALSVLLGSAASPAGAVPPPPPRAVQAVALRADLCRVEIAGTAMPYSPSQYEFAGKAGTTLQLALTAPDPDLLFDLRSADGRLDIGGAGFGAGDVRIRLPASGVYRLSVAAFDRPHWASRRAEFRIAARLIDEVHPVAC